MTEVSLFSATRLLTEDQLITGSKKNGSMDYLLPTQPVIKAKIPLLPII